jgi:cysteine-rich repeat protein
VSQAGPPTICGDGIVEGAEICDDGNTIDGDGCSSNCIPEICGDSILENNGVPPDEECDDGNTVDLDGCDGNCVCEGCGDGFVCGEEECDDGNTDDTDECKNDCTQNVVCGNGILEPPTEECDDGNTIDGDGCSATCLLEPDVDYVATKDDQKCVNGINKSWGGVIKAANKASGKCVKDISKGKVTGSYIDCSNAANLGKAFDKTTKTDAKSCPPAPEMFAYIGDSQAVNLAGTAASVEANLALLGESSNIVPKAEKDASKCQQEVQKGLTKYLDGLTSDANKAKKDCLKGKKVPQCVNPGELASAMTTDGKKGTKALSKWNSKTAKKCAGLPTETIPLNFPSACASSATYTELVACSAVRARCSFCDSLNTADALSVDCDEYASSGNTGSCDPFVPPATTTVSATTTTGSGTTTTGSGTTTTGSGTTTTSGATTTTVTP